MRWKKLKGFTLSLLKKFSTKEFVKIILPFTVIFYYGFIFISWTFYPSNYTIFTNAISDLGIPTLNPFPGYLIFSIACWISSLLTIPMIIFVYDRMKLYHRKLSLISATSYIISSFSTFMVGIFPNINGYSLIHGVFGIISFIGSIFSLSIYWFVMLRSKKIQLTSSLWAKFFILALLLLPLIIVLGIIMTNLFSIYLLLEYPIKIVAFPFFEWLLHLTVNIESIIILLLSARISNT
jgi:hypothetical protein